MIKFLFWNVCGPGLSRGDARYATLKGLLQEAVQVHQIDIAILAESPFQGNLRLVGFNEIPTLTPPNTMTGCRPDILNIWSDNDLMILSSIGKTNLLNRNGMPKSKDSKDAISDHLPLVFSLNV